MPKSFGKLNRRVDVKPIPKKKRIPPATSPSGGSPKFYLYLAGGVLFLIMAGYALAL
jgi:hypothetical protein